MIVMMAKRVNLSQEELPQLECRMVLRRGCWEAAEPTSWVIGLLEFVGFIEFIGLRQLEGWKARSWDALRLNFELSILNKINQR